MPFLPVLPKYLLNNMFIIITFNLYLFIIFFGQKCLDYWTRWLFYYSLSILIFLFKCFKICPSAVISGKKCDLLFYSGLGYNNIFFDCIGFVICSIDISFQVLIFLNKEIFNEVYLRFVFNKNKNRKIVISFQNNYVNNFFYPIGLIFCNKKILVIIFFKLNVWFII